MTTFKSYLKELEEPIVDNKPIDIFFNNLDEATQKKIMDAVMAEKNVAADDEYSNKKIVEAFGKSPLMTFTGKDIVQKIKMDI